MTLSLKRSRPLGDEDWTQRTASRLGIEHTLRREGRPAGKGKMDEKEI